MGFSICWFSESSDHCLIVIRLLSNAEAMVYLVASKLHLQDTVRRGKTKFNEQKKRLDFRLCFNIAWILMSEKKKTSKFQEAYLQVTRCALSFMNVSVQTLTARFNSLSTTDNAFSFY